jgi:hypothetical protein
MKTILRESLTGRYYAGDAGWVADVSQAVEFDSIHSAAALARQKRLETAEVVLVYDEPDCQLTLPLSVCLADIATLVQNNRPQPPKT